VEKLGITGSSPLVRNWSVPPTFQHRGEHQPSLRQIASDDRAEDSLFAPIERLARSLAAIHPAASITSFRDDVPDFAE
jgi:hypothetical protein